MKYHLVIWTLVSALFLPSIAQAGFEWMPPIQNPQPNLSYNAPHANLDTVSGAFPASSIASESLSYQTPTSIVPPRQKVQNLSRNGLVIDPYPLRNSSFNQMPAELSSGSVEQAMVEEARILNPLKLGAGLKTGAQPIPASMPSARRRNNNALRSPFSNNGMTPMVGGEPAPLLGVGVPRAPVMAVPIVQYAQAIGFGRDLPLGLALSQIIPAEFSHGYAVGVDAGITVSWEGGKPWNQVLNEMLRAKNLTAAIQGNQVIISRFSKI